MVSQFNPDELLEPSGIVETLRLAKLLLLIAVALLQVHFCGPVFRMYDGSLCSTCPTLVDRIDPQIIPSEVSTEEHGDCHDCCQLTKCSDSDEKQDVASVATPHSFLLDMPCQAVQVSIPDWPLLFCVPHYEPGAPATGPPSQLSARAPPLSAQSTSAGRADLIA